MKLPFSLDRGSAAKSALGLIVLETDEVIEAEFRTVFGQKGIGLFASRIPVAQHITPETLHAMEAALPKAVGLLPSAYPLDVVGYACTSGATMIGAARIAHIVQSIQPAAKATEPITATMAALRQLGVRRIGLVTPYVAEVSAAMIALLEENGFEVVAFGSFEQQEDARVARISPQSVLEAACAIGAAKEVEAVFISCTNLRAFEIIPEAEARLGKPVISSNLALGWHMAALAGLLDVASGPGRLFTLTGPPAA